MADSWIGRLEEQVRRWLCARGRHEWAPQLAYAWHRGAMRPGLARECVHCDALDWDCWRAVGEASYG